jgi:hypothetical protein
VVLLLIVPLVLGRQAGWPWWTWAGLAASIPALALFVAVEKRVSARGGYPLLNLRILTWPRIAWGLLVQLTAQSTYFAVLFTLALYLQQGLGRSPLYSGLALLPWVAAFGVAGFAIRSLPQRYAAVTPAAGYLWLALVYATLSLTIGLGNHHYARARHDYARAGHAGARDLSGVSRVQGAVSGIPVVVSRVQGAVSRRSVAVFRLSAASASCSRPSSRASLVCSGSCAMAAARASGRRTVSASMVWRPLSVSRMARRRSS